MTRSRDIYAEPGANGGDPPEVAGLAEFRYDNGCFRRYGEPYRGAYGEGVGSITKISHP